MITLVALVIAARDRIAWWGIHVLIHLVLLVVYLGASRKCMVSGKRRFLPHALLLAAVILAAFTELGNVIEGIHPELADGVLIGLDEMLFGVQGSLWFASRSHPLLTEILHLTYASYYFLPLILGYLLYRSGQEDALNSLFFAVTTGFCLSYLVYIVVPCTGPRFNQFFETPLEGIFVGERLSWVINKLENIKQDCYPSGHTLTTLIVLYFAWRHVRKSVLFFAPVTAALLLSTVYLRYHYIVDVVAGMAAATAVLLAAPWVHRRWYGRSVSPPSPT